MSVGGEDVWERLHKITSASAYILHSVQANKIWSFMQPLRHRVYRNRVSIWFDQGWVYAWTRWAAVAEPYSMGPPIQNEIQSTSSSFFIKMDHNILFLISFFSTQVIRSFDNFLPTYCSPHPVSNFRKQIIIPICAKSPKLLIIEEKYVPGKWCSIS